MHAFAPITSVSVSLSVSGQWRVFSGNELGALLGWWMFYCWKQQNSDATAVKSLYMLSSTVSSKILRAIALKEGFHFEVMWSSLRLDFVLKRVEVFLDTGLFMPSCIQFPVKAFQLYFKPHFTVTVTIV